MELLFEIDKKDYDPDGKAFRRPSARGIILISGKIAAIYSRKHKYYKIPGGGIEPGEDNICALIREVKEEVGLNVKPESIKEFGYVHRIQRGKHEPVFIQDNFYYLCDVDDTLDLQSLDDYESDEGFTLKFVSASDAVMTNKSHSHGDYDLILIERETRVIEYLVENNYL